MSTGRRSVGAVFIHQPEKDLVLIEMLTSAWFSFGAGTVCTKHLLWLRRPRRSSADLPTCGQETNSCPHAGSLKRAARRSVDDVQLVAELGGGAEQPSSILHDPDLSAAACRDSGMWGRSILLTIAPRRRACGACGRRGAPSKDLWETPEAFSIDPAGSIGRLRLWEEITACC